MEKPEMDLVSRRTLLRSGLLLASGSVCAPWGFGAARYLNQDPKDDGAVDSWTIGNSLIRRTMNFQPKTGLYTRQLSNLSTHVDLIPAGKVRMDMAQEFSFLCEGHICDGTNGSFRLVGAQESAIANGRSLTINLRHNELPLEVAVAYRVYENHPAVRKHLQLRNTGAAALHISHLKIESLAVSLGSSNETTLLTQYGTVPREIFYTGRSEDAGLLLANGGSGDGIAVINEVPGYMKRTDIGGWDDPQRVSIRATYDTDLMPFERSIAAGETFTTACVSLICFRNGDGFQDPHWLLPSYTAKVLMRRVDAQGPPWIYNTWEPFERSIDKSKVLELIDAASAMGIDIFTIDDGWQQEYGDNAVNLTQFPGGLQPIMDVLEAKGMRLGLWIPLAAIGPSTQAYRDHPEWASTDQQGKPKLTETMGGNKVVMCMASAFRESAAARVIDAIERFRLAYVKLDITTIFNAYGEAPGCWAKGHYHGTWAESLNRIYEGIAWFTSKVYEKHPEVLLDLTFELWGQKHIIDAGLLVAGDLDWMSNVDDREPNSAGPLQVRQLLYQRAASMPAESMLIGNLHADLPDVETSFATVIGSAPLLLGDLRKLSIADRQWYHEKISWFKKLRKNTKISESFFQLGSWRQTTPAAWDGFARLDRRGNGVICLFLNKSLDETAKVQLPLLPEGKFKVHSVISGKDLGVFDRSHWSAGVTIELSGANGVEVLEITSVNQ